MRLQFTVLPPVASGTFGPFYSDVDLAASLEGDDAQEPPRPRYMERTMGVLEGCRMDRNEALRHLVTITGDGRVMQQRRVSSEVPS